MSDLISLLFDTSSFPERWHCGDWSTAHGWTHITADLAIFGAYAAIPCVLTYFAARRRDIPFLPVFWLFAAFIMACGIGHLVEASIFWFPWYRFSGMLKVLTALVSWGTVLALVPVVPKALALRSPAELEREIAQRRETERELEIARDEALKANKAKSAFLATMSHELRTPLNAIIGYSELLQEELEDDVEATRDLQKIHNVGKHLLNLINDILDLSKIEAGKMELHLETFAVGEVVEDLLSTARPLADRNQNALKGPGDAELGVMHADMIKVRQILLNLVSNACRFTEAGTITLAVARLEREGRGWIEFRVRDSGIGIAEDQLGLLFQDFQQIDDSRARKHGGTGLGLALSRRFARMMGGDITAESPPGEGATFIVTLPTQVEPPVVAAGVAVDAAVDEGAEVLLVIDDDPLVLELMERFMEEEEGLRVVKASTGAEGLRLARELAPSVITLDVMMPGMDGWAVLSSLKADPQLAGIPVVMLTLLTERNLAFALGAADFLTKPVERERLSAVLRRYTTAGTPQTVLIVEDDPGTRELLRRALQGLGFSTVEAEDGVQGLERLAEGAPGLILLDLMMPRMDGFEFVEELRRDERWAAIPVVVITAMDLSAEDRQRLNRSVQRIMEKGAQGPDDLARQLRSVIRSARRGLSPG